MTDISASHVVLIPSFNTGAILAETVKAALDHWAPVWVVIDGSDDGSDDGIEELSRREGDLRVFRIPTNSGKGAAVLHGATAALRAGFTHAVTLDADGQHPSDRIAGYVAASQRDPHTAALVLGLPIFGADAPRARVWGRKLSNFWVGVETVWAGVGDSLFGMRVYPLEPLVRVMRRNRWGRRFDFDPELAVRLVWDGTVPVNVRTPVRYLSVAEGGVSHFRYLRDNALLTWMHLRLFAGAILRLPLLVTRRWTPAGGPVPRGACPAGVVRRVAGRFGGHYHRWYAWCKLRTDPLYQGVYRALEGSELPVLDIGCGIGLLAFYLRERGLNARVSGIDCDRAKVQAARGVAEVYHQNMEFTVGDARSGIPSFRGNVTLLDVLQFLDRDCQRELLASAARAVAPGGRLVIRSGIADRSARFALTRFADRFARWVRWMPALPVDYPTTEFLQGIARDEGLVGEIVPWWGRTPFNNYLAVFRRPAAGGEKSPAPGSTHR